MHIAKGSICARRSEDDCDEQPVTGSEQAVFEI